MELIKSALLSVKQVSAGLKLNMTPAIQPGLMMDLMPIQQDLPTLDLLNQFGTEKKDEKY